MLIFNALQASPDFRNKVRCPSPRPCKIVIFGIPEDLSELEILSHLKRQNPSLQNLALENPVRSRRSGVVFVQLPCSDFEKLHSQCLGHPFCSYVRVWYELARTRPLVCYSCGGFGHLGRNCRSPSKICLGAAAHTTIFSDNAFIDKAIFRNTSTASTVLSSLPHPAVGGKYLPTGPQKQPSAQAQQPIFSPTAPGLALVQINLRKSPLAHSALYSLVIDSSLDIAFIQEPSNTPPPCPPSFSYLAPTAAHPRASILVRT